MGALQNTKWVNSVGLPVEQSTGHIHTTRQQQQGQLNQDMTPPTVTPKPPPLHPTAKLPTTAITPRNQTNNTKSQRKPTAYNSHTTHMWPRLKADVVWGLTVMSVDLGCAEPHACVVTYGGDPGHVPSAGRYCPGLTCLGEEV